MSTVIEVSALSKSFGAKQALSDVNFTIEKGNTVALVGPNGAGKTTLFSIICGYLKPDQGKVDILGHNPRSPALYNKLSALPQDAQLDPKFSVAKQLSFYAQLQGMDKKSALADTERVLELVDLLQVAQSKTSELSHGMRKRVCIAQALLGSPEIVLLDEATAGLDPKNAKAIRNLIASLKGQITFILSSHDLSELERLCDTVLYLEQGQLSSHQSDLHQTQQGSYITLQMLNLNEQMQAQIAQLQGVTNVKQTQSDELVIEYTKHAEPLDLSLLTLIHNNQWTYKQIVNGRTLENQLFVD
ncbi:ABC transporter [Pseudoalteromonas luteoviolacea]|uniref:ABC transporter n=1 Tax=Pseudoalteromonas luteoviolacea TaxID=43657 RepID=A0A1C0TW66_9GAMM|nr:ABC transporter ATP-binding protein [Pseudoalteromonas luteoviolacea]MBQ4810087.1 ABC transporter ATP-binding protein [Pseudoalteromonas luteoviolacea]OCQ23565.1 ABC transporter [Pseudoalteromonas luteoviolacea]